jgi:choline dehydrogenase-like flavoprotein
MEKTFEIQEQATVYDAIIVGSGAGGGMAAYQLSKAGAKVLLLEAGGYYDPADPKYITQMKNPWESPRRGASTRLRPFGDFDAAWGGWDIEGQPYTTAKGTEFSLFRSQMLGGRTNHWGRISLRFGPDDFRRGSLTGVGDDWPIGYDDIAPYYDRVDRLIGLFGTKENIPNEPDGIYLTPPKPRLHELFIKKAGKSINLPVIPSRMAMLTSPINNDRGSCFYCAQCGRGCQAYADFSASSVLVIPALKTGNLKLINHAMVREVLTDTATGLAKGVSYIDTISRKEYQVKGKIVILGASATESARLLLNSKSARHPNGLANESEVIGHYINDSTGASAQAFVPTLLDRKRYNEDGVGGMHLYTPWWQNGKKLDFSRGYHIEYGGGMGMPGFGFGMGIQNYNGLIPDKNGNKKPSGGYGIQLKNDIHRSFGAFISMAGRGESVPLYSNYCEIDPNTVDKYGIPVLRFNAKWADEDYLQAKHMQQTFDELIHELGGIRMGSRPDASNGYGLAKPGQIIHEVGTVRMGNDPKKSALNKWQQAHSVKNLFVVDAAPFVSQGDKNVTWTILASSWRTSEYIVEQVKAKNL